MNATDAVRRRIVREQRGRIVREAWTTWAAEQPDPKPSWLAPWALLSDADKEADMRIGDAIAATYLPMLEAILEVLDSVPFDPPVGAAFLRANTVRAGVKVFLEGCSDPQNVAAAIRGSAAKDDRRARTAEPPSDADLTCHSRCANAGDKLIQLHPGEWRGIDQRPGAAL